MIERVGRRLPPELMLRLVHRPQWSFDKYEAWLPKAMADALLAPPSAE